MNEMQSYGDLLDLQDVDLEIDRLIHTRSTLPVLDTYKAAHSASIEAKSVLGDLQEILGKRGKVADRNSVCSRAE